MPAAVVNPASLNLLKLSNSLSFCSAATLFASAAVAAAIPSNAKAPPAILAAIPKPGINIIAAPMPFIAVVTLSANSLIALAPTLAPRSPS